MKAYVPLRFELADAFQFDWSEERLVIGGVWRKIMAAHLKLCRAFVLQAYPTQSHEMPSSIERLTYRGDHLWWSLFVLLTHPQARREAITSRPWLMSSVGHRTEHAGQTTITLTGLHAHFEKARAALMRVSAMLQGWVVRAAEQLDPTTVWLLACEHLKRPLAGVGPPPAHRLLDNHANGIA